MYYNIYCITFVKYSVIISMAVFFVGTLDLERRDHNPFSDHSEASKLAELETKLARIRGVSGVSETTYRGESNRKMSP